MACFIGTEGVTYGGSRFMDFHEIDEKKPLIEDIEDIHEFVMDGLNEITDPG